ncbi:succinylglutamate desuccinylase/aspartoacylase family protein [Oceanihabitans sp.]|nr:succinylglutamate desuccinylase/aspartoacylase family protein [Oceanihabitans sp.]
MINRVIGKIKGKVSGPSVVFFAGIHGNEPAGVHALEDVFGKLVEDDINGTVYGFTGNLKALEANQRYLVEDLNRIWTKERIRDLQTKTNLNEEEREQKELLYILNDILKSDPGPFYFIDIHTTSSKTLPFITINDAIINRNFSKLFPVPIVLGIEEYLNGPLLSYINELGYVSLGFESGQHEDEKAIINSISFIYLTLVYSKTIALEKVIDFPVHYNRLKTESQGLLDIFEVVYLHKIKMDESFSMEDGFKSFQDINAHTVLAISNGEPVKAKYKAKIFMPLYQSKGQEGFFLIQHINPFFLNLSVFLRRFRVDNLLSWLPGVSWENEDKNALLVNLKVTKFFAKSLFHLLGFRNKQLDATHLKLKNRERASKTEMYKNEEWY